MFCWEILVPLTKLRLHCSVVLSVDFLEFQPLFADFFRPRFLFTPDCLQVFQMLKVASVADNIVMPHTEQLCVVFPGLLPGKLSDEIFLAEGLIAQSAQVMRLIVIDRYENDAIGKQELSGKEQAGVKHVQPVGMKTAIRLCIGVNFHAICSYPNVFPVCSFVFLPCVGIDEVLVLVVRRVNVDALDPIAVRGKQTFQDFEILSLNDGVPLGKLWIHGALVIVFQRCECRREGIALRVGLPKPTEFKVLGLRHQVGVDEAFQFVRVESPIVGKQVRHKRSKLFQTFLVHIRRGRHSIHNGLVHNLSSSFSERHSRSSLRSSSLGGSSSL